MSLTVGRVYDAINAFAPFDTAEEWDNAGLLAGSPAGEVKNILCALELNPSVLEEAAAKGCNLVVTHHPILFHARQNLREDDPEGALLCSLVRHGIALIAAHTNFDGANPGVNDALCDCLGLRDISHADEGMRIGTPMQHTLGDFAEFARNALGGPIRVYGENDRPIHRVAVLGGAGGDFAHLAKANGANAYLTGEIAHHKAWDAYLRGVCILEAGHAATELPCVDLLKRCLQNALNGVEWNGCIYRSEVELFR